MERRRTSVVLLFISLLLHTTSCAPNNKNVLYTLRGGETASTLDELDELVKDCVASNRKIVVVTGGVLSGIGKGVTASSIGVLFRAMGLRVVSIVDVVLLCVSRACW